MRPPRRGGRAVECTGLENRHPRKRIVGSNPTLSARTRASKNLTKWRANPSLVVRSRWIFQRWHEPCLLMRDAPAASSELKK